MNSLVLAIAVVVAAVALRQFYLTDEVINGFLGQDEKQPQERVSEENIKASPPPVSVIIVGGGLAGLSASVEAFRAGAKVTLLDKEARLGGNSAKATSGINGTPSKWQAQNEIEDSLDLFKQDVMRSGNYEETDNDLSLSKALVDQLTESSSDAVEFLETFGLKTEFLSEGGGHSRPRTHRTAGPVGFSLTGALRKYLQAEAETSDRITLKAGAKVTSLRSSNGRVTGVVFADEEGEHDLLADSVVLTCGGYGANKEIIATHAPYASNFPTSNGPFALGDGLDLGKGVGAKVIDLNRVQIHPTSFIRPDNPIGADSNILCPEMLRGAGGILINEHGKRFVNELGLRKDVTSGITEKSKFPLDGIDMNDESLNIPPTALLVMNEAATAKVQANINFYTKQGFVSTHDNAQALSEAFFTEEKSQQNFIETLEAYTKSAESGGADEFGKTKFPEKFSLDEKLFAMRITPAVHYTMGGLAIDTDTRVQSTDGGVVEGLFAAGEVTGGVHGVNRLVGNSLLECVVFGRKAGENAAKHTSS